MLTPKQHKMKLHIQRVGSCTLHSAMKAAGYVSGETGTYAFNLMKHDWCEIWQENSIWMIGVPGSRDIGNRRNPNA